MQLLLLAQAAGVFKLGNSSKIHADASKSHAVAQRELGRYKRLLELEAQLRQEVAELFALSEQMDRGESQLPEDLVLEDELVVRQARFENLAQAKAVLEARAQARYEAEKAEYAAKVREREGQARKSKRGPRGRNPKPPEPGARDKDQYNFTDPASRIMKNSTNEGFDQHYNVQIATAQKSLLIVANGLSNHPNDQQEAVPTLDAVAPELGKPEAAALDNGYFSEANVNAFQQRQVEAYIATGRELHHKDWHTFFAELPEPPGEEASPQEKMAYKLQTEIGKAIYRLRKCNVEPVMS